MSKNRTPIARTLEVILGILAIIAMTAVPIALADPASPFTIANIDSPDPVVSGAELLYTITIVNTGGSKATNVVLSDQLNGIGGIGVPPQLAITSSRGSCSQSATLVTCAAGTIEGGGVWVVTIRGIVTAANGTTINNTASVTGTRSAQNFTSTATTTTLVSSGSTEQLPDLTITKNGPTTVAYGERITYSLIVNNQGLANATDVTVVDTLPSQIDPATIIAEPLGTTSLFQCTVSGHTVSCTGGAINQGANATITITGDAPSYDTQLTNTASVDPFNAIPEVNELNNTSALVNTQVVQTPPPPTALSITKVDLIDPIVPGDMETYVVTVVNNAATRADDVVIIDGTQGLEASTLTATFDVNNGTIGNFGGCTVAAPQAKCMARTLNPGGTIVMTVTGKIVASAGTTLLNTSTVTGNIKNTGYSATATEKTTVKPAVDLTVTVADAPDPVCARSWAGAMPPPPTCRGGLEYTFTVGNSGIYDANNVVVRLPLPPGVVYDAGNSTFGPFACNLDGQNVVTCTTPVLGAESTSVFKIMTVAPAVTGPISLTATVDPANAIFESDETNNTFTQATQVITGIDLTTRVVDDPPGFDPIATSGTQTYTITVWNEGTQNAGNIRLRDTLPSGTRFRDVIADPSHNFTCSQANGTVECVGGMLEGTASNNDPLIDPAVNPGTARDTATIIIRVFAQSFAGTMHNEVRVDPLNEIPEANEANNIAVQDTVVESAPTGEGGFNQLTIAKAQSSPDPANTARNAKVTWTITVGNTGSDTAVGVTVRDYLPAGARYIEAKDTTTPTDPPSGLNKFNCSQVSNHVDCVGGEIASGGTATITLTAFAPDTPGDYINQAIVDPDGAIPEGDELDNEAHAKTTVKNAGAGAFYELSITNTQTKGLDNPDPDDTARNAKVTYDLAVANGGSDDVIGVTVRDTLPAGARYLEASGDHQFLCTNHSGIVDCVGGQIPHGSSATIHVTAFAPDTPRDYTNQAIVDPENTIPEGDEENNQAQQITKVHNGGDHPYNDLTIVNNGTTTTTPGGAITYSLEVTNQGFYPALNVAVRDVLPPDTTFVNVKDDGAGSGSPFTCSELANVVTCTGATINGGGDMRRIIISAIAPQQITDAAHPKLNNMALVDPENTIPEGDELNNSANRETTVGSLINLTVKQDGPTTASQSDTTDYTITVRNDKDGTAGDNAIGIVMFDPLPVGLIPLATDLGTGNNWACTIDQNPINAVRCLGDLAPDTEVKIKVTVFITAENGRSLDNVACVDPDNLIVETKELDNCSDVATFVTPPPPDSPDILVNKNVDSLDVTPGQDITYTITVSNTGTAKAASPVNVTDVLPTAKVSFTNFTTTNSWTCSESSGTVLCHDGGDGLDVGQNAEIKILAHVLDSATGTISNKAEAASASCDPSATNCVDEVTAQKTANNTSTITSSVGSSGYDLYVASITDTPDPVAPGRPVKYTIVAGNAGTAIASGAHIAIDWPASGLLPMGVSASNGFTCSDTTSNPIDCHGNLPAGGTTTITLDFNADTVSPPSSVQITAEIDREHAFAETDEGNNELTQTTTISGTACVSCIDLAGALLTAEPEPSTGAITLTLDRKSTRLNSSH